MDVYIRYMHKIAPSPRDVEGPFPAEPEDLTDLDAVRKWARRVKANLFAGKVSEFRIAPDGAVLVFFTSGSVWHGVYIEPPGACSVASFGPAKDSKDSA